MIISLNLEFRELRNAEKSQFVQFRLKPRFKKLFISCRPEILFSAELSCFFQLHTCS